MKWVGAWALSYKIVRIKRHVDKVITPVNGTQHVINPGLIRRRRYSWIEALTVLCLWYIHLIIPCTSLSAFLRSERRTGDMLRFSVTTIPFLERDRSSSFLYSKNIPEFLPLDLFQWCHIELGLSLVANLIYYCVLNF